MVMTNQSERPWTEPLVLKLKASHRNRPPEGIMERHADRLRLEAGQNKFPIDVDLISSVAGVRQRKGAWDFAGRIYAEPDGQLVMDLNAVDGEARQRFTSAHELMHLAFPGFKREARYRLEAREPGQNARNAEEEYLCDLGAAALLMPSDLVRGTFPAEDGLLTVEKLAQSAQVSLQAAGNRLVEFAERPAAFLVFDWSHKPADRPALRRGEQVPPRLRLRYASSSGVSAYMPRFKSAPDDSVFCAAWHDHHRHTGYELLPGAPELGLFHVQAKAYGNAERRVVLATAHQF
jgi:hypothetical protein